MKRSEKIIQGMMEGADLQRVLDEAGVSASAALDLLEGREGKRQREARRALAAIHAEMIALRFRALAASRLCGMLSEEKVDLRMKAALAVLGMTAETMKRDRDEAAKGAEQETQGEEADTELMLAAAEALAERRRTELMGAPPAEGAEGGEAGNAKG
jgi:hypothetical protein